MFPGKYYYSMNVNIYHKHKDIIITTFIIASRAYLQHYHVHAPHSEWLGDGDCFERRARYVRLIGVLLAPGASLDDVDSVGVCGGPVEAVSHSLGDQGASGGVVAAVT